MLNKVGKAVASRNTQSINRDTQDKIGKALTDKFKIAEKEYQLVILNINDIQSDKQKQIVRLSKIKDYLIFDTFEDNLYKSIKEMTDEKMHKMVEVDYLYDYK